MIDSLSFSQADGSEKMSSKKITVANLAFKNN